MDATASGSTYRAIGLVPSRAKRTYRLQLPRRRRARCAAEVEKKADVVEHREVFDHVGLLVSEPPGVAGLPFI